MEAGQKEKYWVHPASKICLRESSLSGCSAQLLTWCMVVLWGCLLPGALQIVEELEVKIQIFHIV